MDKQRMVPSEALVETLAAEGVRTVFGIVGSAFMDSSIPTACLLPELLACIRQW